ncbi:histidine phosphatase family protein [Tistrella mobilis]|uniref:histidine phosphatase family protein n=1 Tax=Tistrella mobilis TaxID=171437 RepID=UPI003557BAC1
MTTQPTRLLFVRHGTATRMTEELRDPPLAPRGREEAAETAAHLAALLAGQRPRLLASPLARTTETATIIGAALGLAPEPAAAFAEIPWTDGQPVISRAADIKDWLGRFWGDMPTAQRAWAAGVVEAAHALSGLVVVVSHFVPINVLVGHARGSDRVLEFRPRPASVTIFNRGPDGLMVEALGAEDETLFA